jgi:putative PIN family toxin of toxin-antitoxin system
VPDLVKRRVLAHELFVSEGMLRELAEKLRVKFDRDAEAVPLFAAYRDRAQMVEPQTLNAPVCRDPDDDLILATAVAARADVIVTDDDLLTLGVFEAVRILSPRQFLEMLDQGMAH